MYQNRIFIFLTLFLTSLWSFAENSKLYYQLSKNTLLLVEVWDDPSGYLRVKADLHLDFLTVRMNIFAPSKPLNKKVNSRYYLREIQLPQPTLVKGKLPSRVLFDIESNSGTLLKEQGLFFLRANHDTRPFNEVSVIDIVESRAAIYPTIYKFTEEQKKSDDSHKIYSVQRFKTNGYYRTEGIVLSAIDLDTKNKMGLHHGPYLIENNSTSLTQLKNPIQILPDGSYFLQQSTELTGYQRRFYINGVSVEFYQQQLAYNRPLEPSSYPVSQFHIKNPAVYLKSFSIDPKKAQNVAEQLTYGQIQYDAIAYRNPFLEFLDHDKLTRYEKSLEMHMSTRKDTSAIDFSEDKSTIALTQTSETQIDSYLKNSGFYKNYPQNLSNILSKKITSKTKTDFYEVFNLQVTSQSHNSSTISLEGTQFKYEKPKTQVDTWVLIFDKENNKFIYLEPRFSYEYDVAAGELNYLNRRKSTSPESDYKFQKMMNFIVSKSCEALF